MNLGDAKVFIDVFLAVCTAALGVYVWLSKKSQVNARRIEKLEEDIDGQLKDQAERLVRIEEGAIARADIDRVQSQLKDQAERLARAEQDRTHHITRDDVDDLHSRVSRTNEGLARLEGEFKSAKQVLDRIHQFLLDKK